MTVSPRPGSSPWRHLPNLLTALRLLAAPIVGGLLIAHDYRAAALLGAAALATDLLDGWLARRFDWQSQLGGWLDPLADKLLMAACFGGLWMVGVLPLWLLLLALLRDAVIVAGSAAYHVWVQPLQARPSWLGKACAATQSIYVLGLMLDLVLGRSSSPWSGYAVGVVGAMVALSGIDYVLRWSQRARRARPGNHGSGQ